MRILLFILLIITLGCNSQSTKEYKNESPIPENHNSTNFIGSDKLNKIEGCVIYSLVKGAFLDANVILLDNNNKQLEKNHTNSKGNFNFQNIKNGTYNIRIEGNSVETIQFDSINISKDTFIVLDGYKECEYLKHKNDSTCIICKKQDKVVPVIYGTIPGLKHIGLINNSYYWGGCEILTCAPSWYCIRDEKLF